MRLKFLTGGGSEVNREAPRLSEVEVDQLVQQLVCVRACVDQSLVMSSGSGALISPAGGDEVKTCPPSFQLLLNNHASRRALTLWFCSCFFRGEANSERTQGVAKVWR